VAAGDGAVRRAGSPDGFVLVAVLGGLLIVGAVVFALLFAVTLEAQAARAAQAAVVERAALEGALQLALAELAAHPDPLAVTSLGPWAALAADARVAVQPVSDAEGTVGLRLEAALPPPARRRPAVLVVSAPPGLERLWRP